MGLTDITLPALAPLVRWLDNVPAQWGSLYLVGGSIRDILLGRPLKDMDLVCANARDIAAQVARQHGARCIPLGAKHDPPSYRVINPRDHADYLDITELAGPDIAADLARRDFTANALALSMDDGKTLIDPLGGLRDIHQGLVRRAGPSALEDDPVRILRGFRLRAQLGWTITPNTLQDMRMAAARLAGMPGERIAAELRLILECPNAVGTVREMAQADVLEAIFPEMTAMRGCTQNRYHHLDVFDHSLAALECCDRLLAEAVGFSGDMCARIKEDLSGWRLPWLKLAVLLHDAGKPAVRSLHPRTGQATFYGHEALGAHMVLEVSQRLRLARAENAYISGLVRTHLHVGAILTPRSTTKARMRLLRRLGPDVIPAVLLCLADTQATLGPASTVESRQDRLEQGVRLIRDSMNRAEHVLSAPGLVSGNDLIALGMRPGPALGRVLMSLREAQDAGEIADRRQGLAMAKKMVHAAGP